MKITWVTRSFLDYRIPVYHALDELCDHNLTVIYNGEAVPQRCQDKLNAILGARAIAMKGEVRIGNRHQLGVANKGIRIPIQKGLLNKIKQTRPNVLISDGFFQWTYAPLLLRMMRWNNIKHIMCYEKTKHTERNAGKWRLKYRRFVSRWIDAIDCNGVLTKSFITETLEYKKHLAFGHMAADTAGIANNVMLATEADTIKIREDNVLNDLTLIYVGRLIPLKGIMQLLEAWKQACLQDASLMLVGEGYQRNEIEKYLHDSKIDNVKLIGAVNYDCLGPYYKVADCFIIPTLEDNWSLVVPEAMAAGLPIACSIYNGCHPELVKSENGWTFDPLDIQDTVRTLKQIAQNRGKLKQMGEKSKEIVANHTPKHAAQGIYDLCKKIVGDETRK